MTSKTLHFDVSSGLKRVLGRELITDDEVAIFELVKNSFDAGADKVLIYFSENAVIIVDNGSGMSYEDLIEKWLFVAYSAKRDGNADDFRDRIAGRSYFAGSKGIGRFSSDRIGESLVLQTRPKQDCNGLVHRLIIDWSKFDADAKSHFEKIPVRYSEEAAFAFPEALGSFAKNFSHGTMIEIGRLNLRWTRTELQHLKASLAKLINPFGSDVDQFQIEICAPAEMVEDERIRVEAEGKSERPIARNIINGRVGNFIFSELQEKTTFIDVKIDGASITTSLTDRGELIYRIKEPAPYPQLAGSGFHAEVYYLNHSAKLTFARRVGLPSVQFGSVFLFRNGFRVYPIGEDGDDWFGITRRKQQGYNRFLGAREVIGRIDVFGTDADFQESSSRNTGLIDTPAVQQLKHCVMDHCIRRLERYVVPVSWVDKADADTDDLSRLLTEPGRARVSAAVAGLVDNDDIELLDYSKKLIGLLNERSREFEQSLVSLRTIAEKTQDREFIERLEQAERRFEELRK
ncbi:MAG: ATP-binding protein, partial [Zavarzinia sp.]|nr:ATP-binding protein [Zavarzinia sp.]